MLDLSKIQAGTRKPEMQLFSLTETVRSTMMRYERLTLQNGYRIDFESAEEVNVIADRGMLLQVIYNLINNAINYTGADQYVLVKQEIKDGIVRISISDTGEGIPEDQLPMIWDRYYRVDKLHKRATVGSGIGLSIVKGILELHHATYGVSSTVGHGSVFWFELPIAKDCLDDLTKKGYLEADYESYE
jgi:signal transduction histidine kinase